MSSLLSMGVAPNASIVAQSNTTPVQRGESAPGHEAAARSSTAGLGAQAAVTAGVFRSEARAPSHGEERKTDAAFEKQSARERQEKDLGLGKAVNVSA